MNHSRFLKLMDTSAVERIREEEDEDMSSAGKIVTEEQSFFFDTSQIPPD